MRCRWDMQDTPPDILITNFSMLSVMLMRDEDSKIFEHTKRCLAGDKNKVFHLVIDELHLYRGSAGAEVAYLIRLLLSRLGLHPGHPQLRILGSSASLDPKNGESYKFLSDFFGDASPFTIIPGYPEPLPEKKEYAFINPHPFIDLAQALPKPTEDHILQVARSLFPQEIESSAKLALLKALESDELDLKTRIIRICSENEEISAVSIDEFGKGIFGPDLNREQYTQAVRGLFYARSLCDDIRKDNPQIKGQFGEVSRLPSFRLHWIFRNVDGLWASTKPPAANENRTVGQLYTQPKIICDTGEKRRVLELFYCNHCGTLYYGGNRLQLERGEIELLPTDPDIEGIPDKQAHSFSIRKSYAEFALFWPSGQETLHPVAANVWEQPIRSGSGTAGAGTWIPASLDSRTATVKKRHKKAENDPNNWIKGYLYHLDAHNHTDYSAMPSICAHCGQDYSNPRKKVKSTINNFRTGFSKISQILTKELFLQIPNEARKIIVFSDSREEAASISAGIERTHYVDLFREMLVHELHSSVAEEDKVVQSLNLILKGIPEDVNTNQIIEDLLCDKSRVDKNVMEFINNKRDVTHKIIDSLLTVRWGVPKGFPPPIRKTLEAKHSEAQ
ncbi:MAG: hypothetical protein KAW93_04085, partial [Methanogenium sp.]|nr:hypothetical protein [Methanogenium sp.]